VADPRVDTPTTPSVRRGGVVMASSVVALLVIVPACSGSPSPPTAASNTTTSSPSTTTSSGVTFQQGSAAQVAQCEADAKALEVALEAYTAQNGAFPSPTSMWGPTTYAANFTPLTSAAEAGPYLPKAPGTTFYVIEYDSSGHIWIAPPGSYGAVYNPGQDFDLNPNICDAAVG
jgi:hypothetical protein